MAEQNKGREREVYALADCDNDRIYLGLSSYFGSRLWNVTKEERDAAQKMLGERGVLEDITSAEPFRRELSSEDYLEAYSKLALVMLNSYDKQGVTHGMALIQKTLLRLDVLLLTDKRVTEEQRRRWDSIRRAMSDIYSTMLGTYFLETAPIRGVYEGK